MKMRISKFKRYKLTKIASDVVKKHSIDIILIYIYIMQFCSLNQNLNIYNL